MIGWPPRDLRAFLALVASVLGAGVITALAFWLVWILWRGGWAAGSEGARIDALAKALFFALGIVLIVISSLGLAINKRSIKASAFGAEVDMSGGEDDKVTATITKEPGA